MYCHPHFQSLALGLSMLGAPIGLSAHMGVRGGGKQTFPTFPHWLTRPFSSLMDIINNRDSTTLTTLTTLVRFPDGAK
ncbi:hypothetical protein F4811DRAFT_504654 [Daldinia bambusicola]|nr:hypothetical protein F4811DRAFT_504654 [Daldinia bambusicola]